jgi:plasmid stabilization system protein ParE
MGKVIWSPPAVADLESVVEYIACSSPDRAGLMALRLIEATDMLAAFPRAGRVTPEMHDPSRREIACGPYRITYTIKEDAVVITAVVHGARQRRGWVEGEN